MSTPRPAAPTWTAPTPVEHKPGETAEQRRITAEISNRWPDASKRDRKRLALLIRRRDRLRRDTTDPARSPQRQTWARVECGAMGWALDVLQDVLGRTTDQPGPGADALREIRRAAWDEGAEATAEWAANNPGPSGVPSDPPRNPYEVRHDG